MIGKPFSKITQKPYPYLVLTGVSHMIPCPGWPSPQVRAVQANQYHWVLMLTHYSKLINNCVQLRNLHFINKMKKPTTLTAVLIILGFLIASACTTDQESNGKQSKGPVDYVNPYMGNISHLLVPTFPTMHLPNSMLRVYPERRDYTECN